MEKERGGRESVDALLGTSTGGVLSISPSGSPLVVNSGQEFKLTCTNDGPVTWVFYSADLSTKLKDFKSKEGHVTQARPPDTGTYLCKSKKNLNSSVSVFVKRSSGSKGITIKHAQRSFLGCYRCVAQQDGVEKQLKGCNTCDEASSQILTIHHLVQNKPASQRRLSIHSLGVNDSGAFTCHAFGTSNATATLNVIGKGYVSLSTSINTTSMPKTEKNLRLVVMCEAYPKPEEEMWLHVRETLQNSSDHYVRITNLDKNSSSSELPILGKSLKLLPMVSSNLMGQEWQ
ncbi:hypothetical protein E2320_005625 [Naja naja]|nr:hypothetical protein E2320_005625 [Naja naja]